MTHHTRVRGWSALLTPANLVTLSRLPLGVLFWWVSDRIWLAILVLVLAGASDVLDGALARRGGKATALGAILDGISDKAFAAFVVGALLGQGMLSGVQAALLAAREVGELPLVLRRAFGTRKSAPNQSRANWIGKAATVFQFTAVIATLTSSPLQLLLILSTAITGTAAAVSYWRREAE